MSHVSRVPSACSFVALAGGLHASHVPSHCPSRSQLLGLQLMDSQAAGGQLRPLKAVPSWPARPHVFLGPQFPLESRCCTHLVLVILGHLVALCLGVTSLHWHCQRLSVSLRGTFWMQHWSPNHITHRFYFNAVSSQNPIWETVPWLLGSGRSPPPWECCLGGQADSGRCPAASLSLVLCTPHSTGQEGVGRGRG